MKTGEKRRLEMHIVKVTGIVNEICISTDVRRFPREDNEFSIRFCVEIVQTTSDLGLTKNLETTL